MTEYKILDITDVANEKFKTLSEEEQLNVVDEALESVSNTISDIYNKQDELYELRRELQDSILAKKTALFNLQAGSIIVGFAKHMDYHYTMVEAYYIKKMSTRMDKLDVISYTYRVDDGDISYKIIPKSISKNTIFNMINEFYVCKLDKATFDELKNLMSEIELQENEFMDTKTYFWSKATEQFNSIEE